MNRQLKHQSKLVAVLTKRIMILNEGLKSPKERIDMIEDVFMDLIKNLTTFGPILKVIYDEYQWQFKALKKNLFIEEILRQKAEQNLSESYETRSNESSDNFHLSPRNSLYSWSSVEKSKKQAIIKKLNQEKEAALDEKRELEEKNIELKIGIKRLLMENKIITFKHESLKENFNTFKIAMANQDDPFVLRLALDQSKRDFSKLVAEFRLFKDSYKHGMAVPQQEYNEIHTKLKKAEKELKELKENTKK